MNNSISKIKSKTRSPDNSSLSLPKSLSNNQLINKLQHQAEYYSRTIQLELQKQSDLRNILEETKEKARKELQIQAGRDGQQDLTKLSLAQLLKRQQKIEYNIEQIVNKNNQINAMVNEMKQIVDKCRSQRVIFSSIFKNLEREIKDHEDKYKSLLVEKFRLQHQSKQVHQPALEFKIVQSFQNHTTEDQNKQTQHNQKIVESKDPEQNPALPINKSYAVSSQTENKIKTPQPPKQTQVKQESKESDQFYILKIFGELGVSSVKQIQQLMGSIDSTNDGLYQQANSLYEKIYAIQLQISKLEQQLQKSKINRAEAQVRQKNIQNLKRAKAQKEQAQAKYQEQWKGLTEMMKQTQQLYKQVLGEQIQINQHNLIQKLEIIQNYVKQKNINKLNNFTVKSEREESERQKPVFQAVLELPDKRQKQSDNDRIMSKNDFIESSKQEIAKLYQQKKLIVRRNRV